ncbi:hypothetical protein PGT21_020174 [Puccinia graminis f. sp. tritici]|uniref:Uncharacterized protein n=1 Tax=Puccinia graminis f. sp. tritici TaxID=56615 RepID=A0A5B0NLS0_PUCGR|nr:hypothetical protein PGT21_020174 [Puccinia graminis f. sp. tritici]
MFRVLDEKNPSLSDSLKSSFGDQQSEPQGFPIRGSPPVTTDGLRENSWDPLEISSVIFDPSALNLPFFPTLYPLPPVCLPTLTPHHAAHQESIPNNPA